MASPTTPTAELNTTGHLMVHSSPRALARHIEWALAREIGTTISIDWQPQPLIPGAVRGVIEWTGRVGTGARLASSLLGWEQLRFETTEAASPGVDGGRWMHTPGLGIAHLATDAGGSAVITEHRLQAVLSGCAGDPVRFAAEMRLALASAWDDELELFRGAVHGERPGDEGGGTVHWLHRVG